MQRLGSITAPGRFLTITLTLLVVCIAVLGLLSTRRNKVNLASDGVELSRQAALQKERSDLLRHYPSRSRERKAEVDLGPSDDNIEMLYSACELCGWNLRDIRRRFTTLSHICGLVFVGDLCGDGKSEILMMRSDVVGDADAEIVAAKRIDGGLRTFGKKIYKRDVNVAVTTNMQSRPAIIVSRTGEWTIDADPAQKRFKRKILNEELILRFSGDKFEVVSPWTVTSTSTFWKSD